MAIMHYLRHQALAQPESGKGLYVTRYVERPSQVGEFANMLGVDLNAVELVSLHCTVCYCRVPESTCNLNAISDTETTLFRTVALDFWAGHDNAGYLILRGAGSHLAQRNAYWQSQGYPHSFKKYDPHITLRSGCSFSDQQVRRMREQLRSVEISLSGEYLFPLKEN